MKTLMKFVGRHKKPIVIGSSAVLVILVIFFAIFFVVPSFGTNKYGSRLDDKKEHSISNDSISSIKNKLQEKEGVTKVTYNKEGRILNFIITFDDSVNLDTAKEHSKIVIDNISEKNLKYYDVQVFLYTEEQKQGFPNIGYKHKSASDFSWGNVGERSE
jgi:divalent metal cation (Fe/Co/Zn/Cd) transporter